MRERPLAAEVALGGVMAGLAALLQAGPLYWPGPGYLLAALGSLPMAVQARFAPRTAVMSATAAALLLFALHVEEAVVFSLTTAPLGLTVGWAALAGRPAWQGALMAALPLAAGMVLLAGVVGLPPLGPWPAAHGPLAEAAFYGLFALGYSFLWAWFVAAFCRRLGR